MTRDRLIAGEICNRDVVVAERQTTLVAAAERMREQHVGCIVVIAPSGGGRAIAGLLTDRDIVTAVVAKGLDPQVLRVEDVMTSDVVTAHESESLAGLLALMQRKGLRRLPVVDGSGALVGLLSLDDLVAVVARQLHAVAAVIEAGPRHERALRR
jgi:CBS domain-containing protein